MAILSRASWSPRHADGGGVIGTSGWREVYLHHSVTNPPGPNATVEQEAAHMRELERIGENEFGQGISYTVVVFPSGRAWQGHSLDRRGAHTYQRNDVARAICLAGNYETSQPTQAMLDGVDRVLAEWGAMGKPSRLTGGHRDVYPTACPGQHAYSKIAYINSRVGVIDQEDELQPDERNALISTWKAIFEKGGAQGDQSVIERLVECQQTGRALKAEVAALKTALTKVSAGNVDHDLLADKVADRLAKRLEA